MQIIPVLDLKGGVVVRARHGDRANYRPIETPLAAGADPVYIALGLLRLAPFSQFYIADLDAIERRGGNEVAVRRLLTALPQAEFWIDEGLADPAAVAGRLATPRILPVVGSESIADAATLDAMPEGFILSLDYRGDVPLGDAALHEDPRRWPARLIVMTLGRVGSNLGPDLERLQVIHAKAGPGRTVYAAGGLRGPEDLMALEAAGAAGILVASALHDGRLYPMP